MRYKDKKDARKVNDSNLKRPEGVSDEQWSRALDLYETARRQGDSYPELTVAQAALETGWFKHMSGNYNYFGQKASKSQKGSQRVTQEYENNQAMTLVDKFRDYDSLEGAMKDRMSKWGSKYANAETVGEALRKIWKYDPKTGKGTGYATDINYDKKITKILSMMGVSSDIKPNKNRTQNVSSDTQLYKSMERDLANTEVKIDNTAVASKNLIDLPELPIEPEVINNVETPTEDSTEAEKARQKLAEEEKKLQFRNYLLNAAKVQFIEPESNLEGEQYMDVFQEGGKLEEVEESFLKELSTLEKAEEQRLARLYRLRNSKIKNELEFKTVAGKRVNKSKLA